MKTKHILIFGFLVCCAAHNLEPSVTDPVGLSDYDISKRLSQHYQRNADNASPEILQQQIFEAKILMVGDPVTIGRTYAALIGLISGLEATIRTVSANIAAHLNNLLSTTKAVFAQWDQQLAGGVDRAYPSRSAFQSRARMRLNGSTE